MSKEILIEQIEVLTEKDAAKYIGMSRSFLAKDRMHGYRSGRCIGPNYIKTGSRSIRYAKKELDAWIQKNTVVRHLP